MKFGDSDISMHTVMV